MKFTNNFGFPEAIVKAIINDTYSKGKADYSASELLMPPQMRRLFILNADKVVEDISDRIWSLFGRAVHSILDDAQGTPQTKLLDFTQQQITDIDILFDEGDDNEVIVNSIEDILKRQPPAVDSHIHTEKRHFSNIADIIITGKPDWYNTEILRIEDYKVTSVWKWIRGDYDDYIAQLNIYKHILIDNGFPVQSLQVNPIFKDWKAYEVDKKDNYPSAAVEKIEIPVWDSLTTLEFIIGRIKLHEQASTIDSADELAKTLPCSNKERWATKAFALVKPGASRASRVFEKHEDAIMYLSTHPDLKIEDRSEYKRCANYCSVAPFCTQWKTNQPEVILEPTANNIILPGDTPPDIEEMDKIDCKDSIVTIEKNKPDILLDKLKGNIEDLFSFPKQDKTVEEIKTDINNKAEQAREEIDKSNEENKKSMDGASKINSILKELGL